MCGGFGRQLSTSIELSLRPLVLQLLPTLGKLFLDLLKARHVVAELVPLTQAGDLALISTLRGRKEILSRLSCRENRCGNGPVGSFGLDFSTFTAVTPSPCTLASLAVVTPNRTLFPCLFP